LKVKESSNVEIKDETGYITIQFNKKQLKKEIIDLFNTYVNQKDVSGILETNEQKKRNQRKFLEKSVDGLKNKMKTHRKGMNLENNKIIKENYYLIGQINKLRKDLKYIDDEYKELEQKEFNDTRYSNVENQDLNMAIEQLDQEVDERNTEIENLKEIHTKLLEQLQND